MRRRDIIRFLLLTLAASTARAQGKVWRIGLLGLTENPMFRSVTLPELAQRGFVEGRNLAVESRIGTSEQMPELARELVAAKPDVIIADSDWALHPLLAVTKSIPVVASPMGADPVVARCCRELGTARWERHRRLIDRGGAGD